MRVSPLILCGFGLAGVCALAAEPNETSTQPALETVVVTATKREEQIQDVAMSVTAVSGADMLRRQESGFVDFAQQVPGLSLQAIDASEIRLVLRGANAGSVGATVATIVDDVPFSMSGAQANGAFFGANVDTYDMNRIEVLRGPQGTLYGATAEGGLIKYVTNPPNLTKAEGEVVAGGAVVDGGSTVGMVKGLVNVPFWDNKAALRISAVEEGQPGWIDDPATGRKNINDGSKYNVRASMLVKPVDEFTARVTVFDQRLNVDGDNFAQVVGAAATPLTPPANQFDLVNGGFNNSSPWPHLIHTRLNYYALSLQYSLPAATILSATSYGQIRRDFSADFTNTNVVPGVTYSDLLGAAYGQPILVAERQTEFLHKFNQELRVTSNAGTQLAGHPFDWQAGLFYTRETTALDQFFDARQTADPFSVLPSPLPPLGGATIPAVYKEGAVFADFTYHFSDPFDVELGARETHIEQSSQVTTFCCVLFGPFDSPYNAIKTTENSTTWSVAPRWHLDQNNLLYARVSTGYRPGGPNLPTPTLPTPPSFVSDSTYNYEIGLKSSLLDRTLTFDVALFDIQWKDIQILSIVNTPTGPVGINGNSGHAQSRGVEWNIAWEPIPSLVLGLLGEYTNAKLTADAPGLNAFSGDKLPHVPDVSVTFNADYRWHAFADFSAFAGGSWSYVGKAFTDFSASVGVVDAHVQLPDYNTLKLEAGLDNDRFSFEIFATNLTNQKGIDDYTNSGGPNQTGLAAFIQPRTIGAQVGVKF